MGTVRPIMMYGSECLTKKAAPVEKFDDELKELVADLIATCKNTPSGVGIAATQIGVMKQVFIGVNDQEFINPKYITLKGATRSYREGCLSIPGVHGIVHRPQKVHLMWQDIDGNEHDKLFKGFEAVVIQHEMDHLDGICFPERMNETNKKLIERDLAAFESGTFPPEDWDKYPIDWD